MYDTDNLFSREKKICGDQFDDFLELSFSEDCEACLRFQEHYSNSGPWQCHHRDQDSNHDQEKNTRRTYFFSLSTTAFLITLIIGLYELMIHL